MQFIRYQTQPVFSPASNFLALREEMDGLFGSAFPVARDFAVDLYQNPDAFVVRAELPGFRKEELALEVAEGVLTVSAKANRDGFVRDIRRSLRLPDQVGTDRIEAVYENGILTVTLPKREEAKPRQIAVEVK